MTSHVCGCGRCGTVFTVERPVRGALRKYAPECPLQEERELEARKRATKAAYERSQKKNPRLCRCGCGKALPRYVRFHPDCRPKPGTEPPPRPSPRAPKRRRRCGECQDQSWRRDPEYGCPECHGSYAPERVRKGDVPMGSALGRVAD